MIVIADASPLHYVVLIEQIAVLSLLYGQVIVPSVVCEELQQPQTPQVVRLWMAHPPPWLDLRPLQAENDPGLLRLRAGERQAILLAQATGADVPVD
jgi:predicted nucleic acid-binding protein